MTCGFLLARRIGARQAILYAIAQLIGAFLASATLRLLFPAHATLGATLPAGSAMQSFILEAILTAILMGD